VPWQEVSQIPRLADGAVHVWWASPAAAAPWLDELLDGLERERRDRLHRQVDQNRFVVGNAMLKSAAAAELHIDAGSVQLERTCADCGRPHGKPRLPGSGLELSLSHSGHRVVIALARQTPVGIDVEENARGVNPDELASTVLTGGEAATLAAVPAPQRRDAFLTYWTRKEAVLKATGDGLRVPLHDVEVSGPFEAPRLLRMAGRDGGISLHDLDAGAGHVAALAVIGPPARQLVELDARALLPRQ
jgi:4'-phosphopantetheinyl transferase